MSSLERRSPDRHRSPTGLRKDNQTRIRALRHAAPYLKRFGGKTFVIKTGGAAVADEASIRDLVEQVALLFEFGIRVVLVHGGGPQSTELSRKLGVRTRFVRHALAFATAGVVIGVLAAAVLMSSLSSQLHGVSPWDPATYLGVPVLFALLAGLAAYVPARRASALDPATVLRSE